MISTNHLSNHKIFLVFYCSMHLRSELTKHESATWASHWPSELARRMPIFRWRTLYAVTGCAIAFSTSRPSSMLSTSSCSISLLTTSQTRWHVQQQLSVVHYRQRITHTSVVTLKVSLHSQASSHFSTMYDSPVGKSDATVSMASIHLKIAVTNNSIWLCLYNEKRVTHELGTAFKPSIRMLCTQPSCSLLKQHDVLVQNVASSTRYRVLMQIITFPYITTFCSLLMMRLGFEFVQCVDDVLCLLHHRDVTATQTLLGKFVFSQRRINQFLQMYTRRSQIRTVFEKQHAIPANMC